MKNKLLSGIVVLLVVGLVVFFIIYIQIGNLEEKRDYCEQDSDCGIQSTCCCFEALNKKFITITDTECEEDIL